MPIPDKFHRDLQKLIEQANPQSMEEMQKLLNSLMGKPMPEMNEADKTPEGKAFDLMEEAWQSSVAKGRELAFEALELWPDCIEAYFFLAVKTKSKKKRLDFFQQGVDIGQKLFGGDFLEKSRGYFWGITETRNYMRCLDGLASTSAEMGQLSKAIVIWEDMISLNPNDNQGIRYRLLPALLQQSDFKSYKSYRKKFPEGGAMMLFNDALAAFMEKGDGEDARFSLKVGKEDNPYVMPLLLAMAPPEKHPDSYTLNSPEEAICYVNDAWHVWHATPNAIQWLQEQREKSTSSSKKQVPPPLPQLESDVIRILVYEPFSPLSPLQFKPGLSDEAALKAPLVLMAFRLLEQIRAQQPMRLTSKGNLPRKLVRQLYDLRIYPSKYIDNGMTKLMGEEDLFPLHIAHTLCNMAKLLTKRHGKTQLSKKGEKVFKSPALLYAELLQAYTQKLNWSYMSYGPENVTQHGWAMTMYMFIREGNEELESSHYGAKYLDLFPAMMAEYDDVITYMTKEERFQLDFQIRFFSRFCENFGLADIREVLDEHKLPKEVFVKKTALADQVFQLVNFGLT